MNADILLSAMWELLSDGLYISVRLRLIIPVMLYWFWKWTLLTWPTMEDEMSWLIQSWIYSEGNSGSVKAIVCCGRNGISNLMHRGIASICSEWIDSTKCICYWVVLSLMYCAATFASHSKSSPVVCDLFELELVHHTQGCCASIRVLVSSSLIASNASPWMESQLHSTSSLSSGLSGSESFISRTE